MPDYLANAGGVIDFHQEAIDDSPAAVLALGRADSRHHPTVLARAAATGETPLQVADGIVRERILAARHAAERPHFMRNGHGHLR